MIPKISVRIKNFRSYTVNPSSEDGFYNFSFEQGVNLLKGSSGVGKSTVFMAISWCLFKKPSSGNTPLYNKGGETIVEVIIEGRIQVTRVSPKTLFTVKLLDTLEVLESEEAQTFIYKHYGKEHVWKTCNYVSQGSINNLINGELTDAQRWEVLYTLAFETQFEDEKISIDGLKAELRMRIDASNKEYQSYEKELGGGNSGIKVIEGELETYRSQTRDPHPLFDIPNDDFSSLMYLSKTVSDQGCSKEDIDKLQLTIVGLRTDIDKLELENDRLGRERRELTKMKEDRERGDKDALSKLGKEISRLQTELSGINQRVVRMRRSKQIVEGVLDSFPELKEESATWDPKTVVIKLIRVMTQTQWLQQRDSKSIIEEGAEEKIKSIINNLELKTKHLELTTEKRTLEERVCKLVPSLCTVETEWLPTLDYETSNSGAKTIVDCPCCSKKLSIVINNGKLIKVSEYQEKLTLSKEMLDAIGRRDGLLRQIREFPPVSEITDRRSLTDLRSLLWDVQSWGSLPKSLQTLVVKLLSRGKVEPKVITDLQSIDETEPRSLTELEQAVCKLEHEIQACNSDREKLITNLVTIEGEFSGKIQNLSEQMLQNAKVGKELTTQLSTSEKTLQRISTDYKWWSEVTVLGITSKTEFEKLVSERQQYHRVMSQIRAKEERLLELLEVRESLQTKLKETADKLALITELLTDLEIVENNILSDCVDRVSLLTNQFLENAFDDPIVVNLVTEKETKGGKGRKHGVGISIKAGKPGLPNLVDRSLDGFSGGETDRISLGFSSAITNFSPFPLLMLDECISSLDTEMKDKVIRALRQQAKMTNKAVVLICHDAVDGLFDYVSEVGI